MKLNQAQKTIYRRLERLCQHKRGLQLALVDERNGLIREQMDLENQLRDADYRFRMFGLPQPRGDDHPQQQRNREINERLAEIKDRIGQIDADVDVLNREYGGQDLLLERLRTFIGGSSGVVTNNPLGRPL